jgi:hypothetical protein
VPAMTADTTSSVSDWLAIGESNKCQQLRKAGVMRAGRCRAVSVRLPRQQRKHSRTASSDQNAITLLLVRWLSEVKLTVKGDEVFNTYQSSIRLSRD